MSTPGIELNLPDLPEVPISLGPLTGARGAEPRPAVPFGTRLRDALTSYLPLLLMVVLALGSWWLVKNSPQPLVPRDAAPPRSEPDYTMSGFSVQRFAPDGRLRVRIEGRQMRHYPDTDRVEIDDVTIRAWAPDGRVTQASARRALGNGDASEIQLLGGAKLRSITPAGQSVDVDSEFLHAFIDTERLRTHLPVHVKVGNSDIQAAALEYDNLAQKLELQGPMRSVLAPRAPKALR